MARIALLSCGIPQFYLLYMPYFLLHFNDVVFPDFRVQWEHHGLCIAAKCVYLQNQIPCVPCLKRKKKPKKTKNTEGLRVTKYSEGLSPAF